MVSVFCMLDIQTGQTNFPSSFLQHALVQSHLQPQIQLSDLCRCLTDHPALTIPPVDTACTPNSPNHSHSSHLLSWSLLWMPPVQPDPLVPPMVAACSPVMPEDHLLCPWSPQSFSRIPPGPYPTWGYHLPLVPFQMLPAPLFPITATDPACPSDPPMDRACPLTSHRSLISTPQACLPSSPNSNPSPPPHAYFRSGGHF